MVTLTEGRNFQSTLSQMDRALEGGTILTSSLISHTNHLVGIMGRKEVCWEIVIDKLKLFQQPPDNLKDHQLEPEEIPEEDPDEDVIEPTIDPQERRERIDHILCKDDVLRPEDLEDEAIYEGKEGDWGTGMPLVGSRPPYRTRR